MAKTKQITTGILSIFLILGLISLISAESYCFLKMRKGEKIHISSTDYYTCTHTICQICVNSQQWYAGWNKCGSAGLCENMLPEQPLTLSANFPFQDNGVFTKQTFFMDILTNKIANIDLIDNVAGTERNLCPNCMEYKKSVNFKEGFNDITIRAVKGLEIKEKRIKFFIDNKKPRIFKTLPQRKQYANGSFSVFYDETNVKKVELYYGSLESPIKKELSNCESGKKKECSVDVDLTPFDGKDIMYWFSMSDIADNNVLSKPLMVYVDKTAPVIVGFSYLVKKNNVDFVINITEANPSKITYQDNDEARIKILCTSMRKDKSNPSLLICSKKVSFKSGHHTLKIDVIDKAGNFVSRTIDFDVA